MFTLSNRLGWRIDNPAAHVDKYREKARDRVLSDEEIKWFWHACDDIGGPWGAHGKVLLLTGQRYDEVAGMHRDEIDGDVWNLSSSRTKNNRDHSVPLTGAVRAILAALPQSGYVFTTNGLGPIHNSSKAAKKFRDHMNKSAGRELPHWQPHDLRRTAATGLAGLGVPVQVTEAVLNHVSGTKAGIVGVYQKYSYAPEKAEALAAWESKVLSIVGGGDGDVVPFRRSAG